MHLRRCPLVEVNHPLWGMRFIVGPAVDASAVKGVHREDSEGGNAAGGGGLSELAQK